MLFVPNLNKGKCSAFDAVTRANLVNFDVPGRPIRIRKVLISTPEGDDVIPAVAVSTNNPPYHMPIHDAATGKKLRDLSGSFLSQSSGLETMNAGSGGRFARVVVGDQSSNVEVFNAENGNVLLKLKKPPKVMRTIRSLAPWGHEDLFVGGTQPGQGRSSKGVPCLRISWYDLNKGPDPLRTLSSDCGCVNDLAVMADEGEPPSSFLSFGQLSTRLWDLRTPKQTPSSPIRAGGSCGYYAPDLHLIIVGQPSRSIVTYDSRKMSARLARFNVGGCFRIARVDKTTFASARADLVWWTPEGKILQKLGSSDDDSYEGLCSVGSKYDRPILANARVDVDLQERFEFLQGKFGDVLRVQAGKTVVSGICTTLCFGL